ncbi:A/G-specific adenine glycosylase [Paracoccus sp. SCSIO 75233]|uniref:A/G-specific adenine glycosylase n=1 Tax=Paracoccus sp. SCSIO 75233 TaxID=3017782 RepID=UPI0022F06D53|nr:A/G-specific adenine glycosylase [Paracoccus sp. SCSIO 75233]WBU52715.1 A/G-specific adenine glycosylase [Paracoccus sp. SCSIO 75233]
MREIAPELLAWYDRHARQLPWRVPPGQGRADPYRVWLSEIMLQQTTVAAVKAYYERFTTLWPGVGDLAAARDEQVMAEWAGLGYYARARNLLACARQVVASGGAFPATRAGLQALPGIGPYTSAAIAAIAYDQPETVVDGNVERVVARLFAVQTPLPAAKPELVKLAETLTPQQRPGDFAQAMMDLGATICTPRNPACAICPLVQKCDARAQGIAADLPRRAAKPAKPRREGVAWVVLSGERILLERRPPKGLLGGTLAFPSAGWDGTEAAPPVKADWQRLDPVNHVFTHFSLDMEVRVARIGEQLRTGSAQEWVDLNDFSPSDLPGLMRKVWKRAKTALP